MLVKFATAKLGTIAVDTRGLNRSQRADLRLPQSATGISFSKSAHRAEFNYTPRPGYIYVRSRAISSRTNDNFDTFFPEELKKSYGSFIGKPVFVNHKNENHRRSRGVIIDAALHEDVNPDGSPDVWVEVLHEIDAVRFPMLARAIISGESDRTSMGMDVAFSRCSVCQNVATSPAEYCKHIPAHKGKIFRRRNQVTGAIEDVLCHEECYGYTFFENSHLVEDPADPTAFLLGVDASALQAMAFVRPSIRRTAGVADIVAPPKVDTLRDAECPVCGETNSFDGQTCLVCKFQKPPDLFMDPDLDMAGDVDLRQEQNEQAGTDQNGLASTDDLAVGPGMEGDELEDVDGDFDDLICPDCSETFETGDDPTEYQVDLDNDTQIDPSKMPSGADPREFPPEDRNDTLPDHAEDKPLDFKKPFQEMPKSKGNEDQDQPGEKLAEGSQCPFCGGGPLQANSDQDAPQDAPEQPATPDDNSDVQSGRDGDDDGNDPPDDDDDKSKPPWAKDKDQPEKKDKKKALPGAK